MVTSVTRVIGSLAEKSRPRGESAPHSQSDSSRAASEVPAMLVRSETAPPATAAANRESLLVR